MPSFEEERAYCFANAVGLSICPFVGRPNGSWPLSWKLYTTELSYFTWWFVFVRTRTLLILGSISQRSRSQWSLVKNVNMVSAHYHENYLSQSFNILYADWSWWRHDPYRHWVKKVKGQGEKDADWSWWRHDPYLLSSLGHRVMSQGSRL